MTHSTRKRINRPALLLALLVTSMLGAAAMHKAMSPSVIATVDIVRCFNTLDERAALEASLNERVRSMTEVSEGIKRNLEIVRQDLQDLQPGSPKYLEKESEALKLARELQTQVDLTALVQRREYSRIVLLLYNNIRAAAQKLATSQDIDIVFVDDTKVEIEPDEQDVTRQISARRMLYVNPEIDVTDELIQLMNAQFQMANQGPQLRGN